MTPRHYMTQAEQDRAIARLDWQARLAVRLALSLATAAAVILGAVLVYS